MSKHTVNLKVSGTATQEITILNPDYSLEDILTGLKNKKLTEVQYRDNTGSHWGLEHIKGGIVANLTRAEFKLTLDNGFEKTFKEQTQILFSNKEDKKKSVKKLGM